MLGLLFSIFTQASFAFEVQPRADLHNGLSEVVWIDVGMQSASDVLPLITVSSPDGDVSLSTSDQAEVLAVVTPRLDVDNFSLVLNVAGVEEEFKFPVTEIPNATLDVPKTINKRICGNLWC